MKRANNKVITIFMLLLTINIHAASLEERLTDPSTQKQAIEEIQKDSEKYVDELKSIIQINKKAYRKQISGKEEKNEEDKNKHAKVTATLVLGRLKIDSAREIIEDNLTKDEDKFVREASALALAEMFSESGEKRKQRKNDNVPGLDKSIEALRKALEDESGNVRMRAILALAKVKQNNDSNDIDVENLKKRVLIGIKSSNATESLLAVDAIEAIGDKSLIPILKQNLESKNVWIKIHSKLAIKKLEIQGLIKVERLDYLKEALKDEQFEVSRWAGEMLMTDGSKEAKIILEEAVKTGNEIGKYIANKMLWKMSIIDKNKLEKNKYNDE